VEEHYAMCKVSDHKRKCTDLGCCGLFFIWWCMWLALAITALDKGDPIMLVYGQDYQGAQCGVNDPGQNVAYPDHKDQPLVVYPRLNEDLMDWASGSNAVSDIQNIDWYNLGWEVISTLNLTGICVEECPNTGDVICTDYYNDKFASTLPLDPIVVASCRSAANQLHQMNDRDMCDNCWTTSINTTDVFNRCLELIITGEVSDSSCLYPKGISSDDPDCITLAEVKTLTSVKPAYSNPMAEYMGAGVQYVGKLFSDTWNSIYVVWVTGLALSLVLSFAYIVFLYWCAAPLVWLTIIGYLTLHTLCTIWLWMASGYISGSDILIRMEEEIEKEIGNITFGSELHTDDGEEDTFYLILAIICSILLVVGTGLVMTLFHKIRIAVKIIQETSKAMMHMPELLLFPAWSIICMVLLWLYFFVVGVYLATMEDVTIGDLAADAGYTCDNGCNSTLNYTEVAADCTDCNASYTMEYIVDQMKQLVDDGTLNCTDDQINAQVYGSWDCGIGFADSNTGLNTAFFLFHLFSFLWNANLLDAIGITCIAGAVCQWYWTRPTGDGKKKKKQLGCCPMIAAYSRVFRFHLGSMAYGSAIVAIVQMARIIMAYIDHKTKTLQDKYCIVRYLMKVVQCLLWCFEKSLKFITKNAYIYIAMRGYSFCKAARNAFTIFLHNMAQFGVTMVITTTFIFLGKVMITSIACMVAYAWVNTAPQFEEGAEDELHLPILPVAMSGILAYFCAKFFLGVYELAICSILVCFCEDYRMHVATGQEKMVFMSPSLRKAVLGGHIEVLTEEQIQESIKNHQTMKELDAVKVRKSMAKTVTTTTTTITHG